MGCLLIWLVLKPTDPLLTVTMQNREMRVKLPKSLWHNTFSILGKRPFQYKEDTAKGHFLSFTEKGRGPGPQNPTSCTPAL